MVDDPPTQPPREFGPGWFCRLLETLLHGVLPERGGRLEGERHGVWMRRAPGGRALLETTWVRGQREGPTTRWFLSGRKLYSGVWTDGKKTGEWFYFHRDGKLDTVRTGNYSDGLRFSGIKGFNDWNT